jgi:hypothetical protein
MGAPVREGGGAGLRMCKAGSGEAGSPKKLLRAVVARLSGGRARAQCWEGPGRDLTEMRLFEEVSRSEEELAPAHGRYRQRAARLDLVEGRRRVTVRYRLLIARSDPGCRRSRSYWATPRSMAVDRRGGNDRGAVLVGLVPYKGL